MLSCWQERQGELFMGHLSLLLYLHHSPLYQSLAFIQGFSVIFGQPIHYMERLKVAKKTPSSGVDLRKVSREYTLPICINYGELEVA